MFILMPGHNTWGCFDQGHDNKVGLPIDYASKFLNQVERNYTTMEKETLVMIYVVKKI
jgi:hypothetical protein